MRRPLSGASIAEWATLSCNAGWRSAPTALNLKEHHASSRVPMRSSSVAKHRGDGLFAYPGRGGAGEVDFFVR